MNNKIPHEAWSRLKPSVGHVKIFGSLCFRHVPEQLRRKLDDRRRAMVIVGYHSIGAYKLFSPTENKVVINKYMNFDESKSWNWLKILENTMQEGESSSHISTHLHDEEHVAPPEHA